MVRKGTGVRETESFVNLTVKKLDHFSQVEKIYASLMRRDFCPDELRSLRYIRKFWYKGEYLGYGLYDGGHLLVYAFVLRRGRHYGLDYFAVSRKHRGKGLGSAFLKELSDRIPDADCVLVEVEDPDAAQEEETRTLRQRRIGFYLRNGFYDTGIRSCAFGVDYRVLNAASESRLSVPELRDFYVGVYRSVLSPKLFDVNFRIK